jgi:hypothetical protein
MTMARRRPNEDKRRANMRRRGVPEALQDGVLDWKTPRASQPKQDLRSFLVALGFFGLYIGAYMLFQTAVTLHAKSMAAASGAWLVRIDVNAGLAVFLLAVLAAWGWLNAKYEKPKVFLFATANMYRGAYLAPGWYLRSMAQKAEGAQDAEAFLQHVREQHLKTLGIGAAVFIALSLALIVAESQHFTVAGRDGLVNHKLFPPLTSDAYRWSEATRVDLTCVKRGGGRYSSGTPGAAYIVTFSNGKRFDLGNGLGIGGSSIDQLRKIDAEIPGNAVYVADMGEVFCRQFDLLKRRP